jgi:uncharacterized protein YciI
MFLVLIRYTKPLEEVERIRASHRSFLDECVATGHLLVSGPRKPKTGGVILARAGSLEEVKSLSGNKVRSRRRLAGMHGEEASEGRCGAIG